VAVSPVRRTKTGSAVDTPVGVTVDRLGGLLFLGVAALLVFGQLLGQGFLCGVGVDDLEDTPVDRGGELGGVGDLGVDGLDVTAIGRVLTSPDEVLPAVFGVVEDRGSPAQVADHDRARERNDFLLVVGCFPILSDSPGS